MRNCKNLKSVSSSGNRRGFTWFQLLHPEPQPEVEPVEPFWSTDSCETTYEEYTIYKVIEESPQCFLPGHFYKIGNLIYTWDSQIQKLVCIDYLREADSEDESVALVEKTFSERDV